MTNFQSMGPLERIVHIRDAVGCLCRAIDAGQVTPDESEILALAVIVEQHGGPLAHDLICQLASRCRNGRHALDHTVRRRE